MVPVPNWLSIWVIADVKFLFLSVDKSSFLVFLVFLVFFETIILISVCLYSIKQYLI